MNCPKSYTKFFQPTAALSKRHNQWWNGWTSWALFDDGGLQHDHRQESLWRRGWTLVLDKSHGIFLRGQQRSFATQNQSSVPGKLPKNSLKLFQFVILGTSLYIIFVEYSAVSKKYLADIGYNMLHIWSFTRVALFKENQNSTWGTKKRDSSRKNEGFSGKNVSLMCYRFSPVFTFRSLVSLSVREQYSKHDPRGSLIWVMVDSVYCAGKFFKALCLKIGIFAC